MANNYALSGPLDSLERGLDKLFGKEVESASDAKRKKRRIANQSSKKIDRQPCIPKKKG